MINFSSTTQISILFFGGTIKEEVSEPVLNELGVPVTVKSGPNRGQVKTKKVTKEIKVKGLGIKPDKSWATKKAGIYQTNEKVLKEIANGDHKDGSKLAGLMLEIREKEKLLNTYYTGVEKFIHTDGCVHPQFSHCGYERDNGDSGGGTNTGRLSCKSPNVQNVPRSR